MEAIRLDLGSSPVFLVDCQTSGTSPKSGGRIIELAWCATSAEARALGPIGSTLVALPEGAALPRKVSALTGIAAADLEDAPSLAEALGICAGARQAAGGPALVAHYARFERSFFEAAREESGADAGLCELVCHL